MTATTMGVKLDDDIRARMKKLAEMKNRSTHWLMKDAITRYLATEERFEQEKADDHARYKRYLETGEHLTHDEMTVWLDSLASQADNSITE